MSIRLFLVDDHQIVLEGLRLMLGQQPGMEVVGAAYNCEVAWMMIVESKPDVVLMDLDVPGEGGLALTGRIRSGLPDTKVIVLTGQCDGAVINTALRVGAHGFVLKLEAGFELGLAIRTVQAGEMFVSQKVSVLIAGEVRRQMRLAAGPAGLSAREIEIVRRVGDGRSTKEIAFELQLSTKTVETHRKQIMDKIGIGSIAELTKFALREGLTRP